MTVNAPIKVVCESCLSCPDLEIDIRRVELYGSTDGEPVYANYLYCKYYNRCKRIYDKLSREEQGSK